jgi:hypothetical protein
MMMMMMMMSRLQQCRQELRDEELVNPCYPVYPLRLIQLYHRLNHFYQDLMTMMTAKVEVEVVAEDVERRTQAKRQRIHVQSRRSSGLQDRRKANSSEWK